MGKRRPERDQAREIWEKSGGKKPIRELATELGVSESLLRKWKSLDKWTAKKPRGAPKGNQNAKGHKGPSVKSGQGNRNAQTHGAYAAPEENRFSQEQKETVEKIQDEMLRQLVKKYYDLENRIEEIRDDYREKYITGGIDGANPVEYWDSKIKWLETLEQRSIRILGKIQKFFDQQQVRQSLEVHREISIANLNFQKEKAMGIFDEEIESQETEEPPED